MEKAAESADERAGSKGSGIENDIRRMSRAFRDIFLCLLALPVIYADPLYIYNCITNMKNLKKN